MRADPIEGFSSTPFKAKYLRSPMYALPVSEKAREYPQKNHWNDTTARIATDRNIIDNAFLRRRRPE